MKHLDPNEGWIPAKVPKDWYEAALERAIDLEAEVETLKEELLALDSLIEDICYEARSMEEVRHTISEFWASRGEP